MIAHAPFLLTLALAATVGAAAGYIGAFMVLRRMALVGDALTHVALPGIGLALVLGINPMIGALLLLVATMQGIFLLERRTRIYSEAIVGLFFSLALAVGILITEDSELFESLFGDITRVSFTTAALAIGTAIIAIALTHRIAPALILTAISPELARTHGVRRARVEYLFLLLVAVIVALGIGIIGTLLMGALVVLPAITAKNIAWSFRQYTTMSIAVGMGSATAGMLLTAMLPTIPPGVAVILVGVACFILSLPFRHHE